jgi:hypothetical protein
MLDEKEFQSVIKVLQSTDVFNKSHMLQELMEDPCNDERILPYLEELATDKTPCIVSIPYQFGEIRWLAIHALVEEKKILGIKDPVQFNGVGMILRTEEVFKFERKYNIKTTASGREASMQAYGILRDMGKVPLVDITLNHPDPKIKQYNIYNVDEECMK